MSALKMHETCKLTWRERPMWKKSGFDFRRFTTT